ncbi:MAG: histidinol-phosphate transaminase [Gammaproteobacteria bacterium]
MSIHNLIRDDLKNFKPYSSARDESKENDMIFLNANESPWEYTQTLDNIVLNRYPSKQPKELLPQLAELYQVLEEQLMMLRGSDEAIDLLIRLFCSAREDAIMICPPTFGMYAVGAALQGVEVIEVPLYKAQDYQLNYSDLLLKWTPKVKIVFLCSPNNPTGNLLNPREIINLCNTLSGKSIVVVDEAYIEFSDQESMTSYLDQCENLVVLRTFSKAFGLAGARCGFLLAQKEIVDWIRYIVAPYPLSSMVIEVVAQALSSARLQEVQDHILTIQAERGYLFKELKNISWIKKVWVSAANYILIEVEDAAKTMQFCNEKGFVLRDMSSKPQLENCIRISIGKPEENKLLLQAMQSI